jgi:hypothetical protein
MPAHPVNEGLSGPGLSFWFISTHHSFTAADPQFSVVATTGAGDTLTIAAVSGQGRLFLTGQDPDYHWLEVDGTSPPDAGARLLLTNALNWACASESVGGTVELPGLVGAPPAARAAGGAGGMGTMLITSVSVSAAALTIAGAAGYAVYRRRRQA